MVNWLGAALRCWLLCTACSNAVQVGNAAARQRALHPCTSHSAHTESATPTATGQKVPRGLLSLVYSSLIGLVWMRGGCVRWD